MSDYITQKRSLLTKIYFLQPMIKLLLAIALFLIIFLIGIFYLYQQSDTQLKDIDYQRTQLEKSITTQARTYGQLTAIAKNMSNEKNQYQTAK